VQDELLVYDPRSERVVALNASAHAIWALCDGRRSATEVAATLGERLGMPAEALEADVGEAVAELRKTGFLESIPD
jgi:PqqD family protein of HPr-rel-A system